MNTEPTATKLATAPAAFDARTDSAAPGRHAAKPWLLRGLPWLTTIAVLALWELCARTGLFPPEVPAISSIGSAFGQLAPTAGFADALVTTLEQFAVGLTGGAVAGLALGVALGAVPLLHRLAHYLLDFLRFVPAVVYLPLLLLLLGAGPRVSTLLGMVGALWPMLFQTLYGVSGINDVLRDTARVFGLRPLQRLWHVVLPAVLPFVATGVRLAASHVLVVVVAVEIIASVRGIGADIAVYASNAVYPRMYALVFVVGVLGVLVNVGLLALERRVLRWHVAYREEA
ncbi:ABC transporter permease subunit [Saccharopolyspora sp. K220]|uniref:ABC transporter permease n=1 Tax=Saccharopolyspora soli TaxID=2926618 RepID=UPI001F563C14|nr:ABC transporter permease subunit [Saccharopolyspora soli]MCI2417362.1 ABC transporter permease subunit [Saccharopolyspora soli]